MKKLRGAATQINSAWPSLSLLG